MREINSVFVYKLQNMVVAHVPTTIVISRDERAILVQSRTTLLNFVSVLIGVLIDVYNRCLYVGFSAVCVKDVIV